MSMSKYSVRVDNVFFLSRIGLSLRWATRHIAREELPTDIRQLLTQLDQLEAQEQAAQAPAQGGPREGDPAA